MTLKPFYIIINVKNIFWIEIHMTGFGVEPFGVFTQNIIQRTMPKFVEKACFVYVKLQIPVFDCLQVLWLFCLNDLLEPEKLIPNICM